MSADPQGIARVVKKGHPAEMDAIRSVAVRHGIRILEDAAQAHGATYRGVKTGALADAGAFSFYPGKNLGALGDAGAIVTNDDDLAVRVRRLRNYGSDKKYAHREVAGNSRLDELQAAFLRIEIRPLDELERGSAHGSGAIRREARWDRWPAAPSGATRALRA